MPITVNKKSYNTLMDLIRDLRKSPDFKMYEQLKLLGNALGTKIEGEGVYNSIYEQVIKAAQSVLLGNKKYSAFVQHEAAWLLTLEDGRRAGCKVGELF